MLWNGAMLPRMRGQVGSAWWTSAASPVDDAARDVDDAGMGRGRAPRAPYSPL